MCRDIQPRESVLNFLSPKYKRATYQILAFPEESFMRFIRGAELLSMRQRRAPVRQLGSRHEEILYRYAK